MVSRRVTIAAAVVAVGLAVAVEIAWDSTPSFDAETWRAGAVTGAADASLEYDNPRYDLAGPLIRDHLHEGMTRDAVLQLLGPPDSVQGTELHYVIGANPYHIDPDALVIGFDADDRVTQVRIIQY